LPRLAVETLNYTKNEGIYMKIKIFVYIVILGAFLSSCGPSESHKEEAYEAGWNSIWNERCQGIAQPLMVPSKYDDSNGSGEILGYYRSGIADASANPNLCK
jgi:hypothetical protein